jgi:hypothetical protein
LTTLVQFNPKIYLKKKLGYNVLVDPTAISKEAFFYTLSVLIKNDFSLQNAHLDLTKRSRVQYEMINKGLISFNSNIFMLNSIDLQIANIISNNLTVHKNVL